MNVPVLTRLSSIDRVFVCYTRDTCKEHIRHGSVTVASALLWRRCTACMLWYVPYGRPMCGVVWCGVMFCVIHSFIHSFIYLFPFFIFISPIFTSNFLLITSSFLTLPPNTCTFSNYAGIVVSIVPRRHRPVSSSLSLVVFNLFGYFLSLVLSGYLMQVRTYARYMYVAILTIYYHLSPRYDITILTIW
jgi:hypothetical protein